MKNPILAVMAAAVLFTGCSKPYDEAVGKNTSPSATSGFTRYTIPQGSHYSDLSTYKTVETLQLKFAVRFDSSAIYQTSSPENQYDINKLYGFSDNDKHHHEYSARIGWRWSDGALRLFAYIYNEGVVDSKEITSIPIGQEAVCSIGVSEKEYVFNVNGITQTLPRKSSTPKAKGYQLYPYFGGDEPAPHEVRIWLKNL
jgi:hypothetical protein